MTNNEISKIKDKKEKLAMLRKEIIGASIQETKERNISIRKEVLEVLEEDGFNLNEQGTQYLASLITIFYHERKMYRRKDIEDKSYWNLDDWSNEHYGMLGNEKESVVNAILSSIGKNEIESGPIDDLVYDIADSMIYRYNRDDERRERYTKLLSK